jgi:hypothetical protein
MKRKNKRDNIKYEKKRDKKPESQRELNTFAKRELLRDAIFRGPNLLEVEDRRRIKRLPEIRPKKINGVEAKIYEKHYPGGRYALKFDSPRDVVICMRRKKRRESLFKAGKIGKGRKVSPFRKYTEYSHVRC